MIETSLFPYENFPVRLHQKEENRVCWFKDEIDLQKYLNRYKLDKRTIKIDYRDGEPTDTSKKRKRSVEQKPKSKSDGSSSTNKKRTSSLDTTTNIASSSNLTKRAPKRK